MYHNVSRKNAGSDDYHQISAIYDEKSSTCAFQNSLTFQKATHKALKAPIEAWSINPRETSTITELEMRVLAGRIHGEQ